MRSGVNLLLGLLFDGQCDLVHAAVLAQHFVRLDPVACPLGLVVNEALKDRNPLLKRVLAPLADGRRWPAWSASVARLTAGQQGTSTMLGHHESEIAVFLGLVSSLRVPPTTLSSHSTT